MRFWYTLFFVCDVFRLCIRNAFLLLYTLSCCICPCVYQVLFIKLMSVQDPDEEGSRSVSPNANLNGNPDTCRAVHNPPPPWFSHYGKSNLH